MKNWIRVVECGGQGARAMDVRGEEVFGCQKISWGQASLKNFAISCLKPDTLAIIYSVAGMVKDHAKVIQCPNVHSLDGMELGDRKSDPPSFVINDMEAAITGMAHFYPDLNYFMGITRSTGIGARVWKDGKILSDSETGHMKIDSSPFAPLCGCGQQGCAETFIAGNAITKLTVGEMYVQGRKIPEGVHPCKWFDTCWNNGEEWAVGYAYKVLVPAMAQFLANIQTVLHLPAIVWKGTLGLQSFREISDLEAAIREEMKRRIMNPSWVDDLKFYMLDCPQDHDAYIGAAKIARNLLFK